MLAAAMHIESQVAQVIEANAKRGKETSAKEVLQTISIARATYETMVPKN